MSAGSASCMKGCLVVEGLPDVRCVSDLETLYISYDGMLEPLGESQVVRYLEGLARHCRLTLLSFEKPADLAERSRVLEMERRLRELGICWIQRRYHKWPPIGSTLWDVIVGFVQGTRICRQRRIDIVHARGYVPALIALLLKRSLGPRFIFDMRGFWPEEKVDAGHWSRDSVIYAVTKRCERLFFGAADGLVSLTEEGLRTIRELGLLRLPEMATFVIPTCTDLERFSPGPKDRRLMEQYGLDGRLVIGCTGTMSNWYLRQPMITCLAYLVKHLDNVKLLLVTQENHQRLRDDLLKVGISDERFVLARVPFSAMPAHVRLMDVGLFFIKPTFSKRGSSATKLGEFLATGVPVIINDGVGDSGQIVRSERVGLVLRDTMDEDFRIAVSSLPALLLDQEIRFRCRETARRYFDLTTGVEQYAALYRQLMAAGPNSNTEV